MKFGLRFALLAQTKCQNMAPRLSRVTRLSTSSPSYDYASEDCTVVFDADGVALRGHETFNMDVGRRTAYTSPASTTAPGGNAPRATRRRRGRERFRAQAPTAWKRPRSCRA